MGFNQSKGFIFLLKASSPSKLISAEKAVKKPLTSPLEASIKTKAADIATKPLEMITPQERKFMQAYAEMEKARLGIETVKLNPKK